MILSKHSRYAVVTGAAGGLGSCFARELAQRGVNLIITDVDRPRLDTLALALREYGVECVAVEADITQVQSMEQLCKTCEAYDIFLLINNAGVGGTKDFVNCELAYLEKIIQLNITASTLLTHNLLPNIIRGGGGYVLNVSSMAALSPTGWKTIYPASKRFVMHFSQGLNQELRSRNVRVSVVLPGPMRTNGEIAERIDKQGFFGRFTSQSPSFVAKQSIDAMQNGCSLILPGVKNRIFKLFLGLIPDSIRLPIMSRVIAREING